MTIYTSFNNVNFAENVILHKNNQKIIFEIQETLINLPALNVINNKKNRAQLLLDQYKKTKNLDFFNNEKENFSYSGF